MILGADPKKIDQMAQGMPNEAVLKVFHLVTQVDELIERLEAYVRLGLDEIVFYDVTPAMGMMGLTSPEAEGRWERIFSYFREKYP